MEFVHAANTGDWSGSVCASAGKAVEPLQGSSSRERSFRAVASYQHAIVTLMCGRDSEGLAFIRTQSSTETEERASASLKTAMVHASLVAYLRGDVTVDVAALNAATAAPDQALVGPPLTLRTNELLGEVHLKAGRARDAVADYERALVTTPNRASALLGLARARAAAGDRPGASDAYKQLLANWHKADADLATLTEARGGS